MTFPKIDINIIKVTSIMLTSNILKKFAEIKDVEKKIVT